MANLTDKQKRFCLEYIVDYNATQAAIRAGYSFDTAKNIGCENLSKPYLREYINKLIEKVDTKTWLSKEYVLNGFKKIFDKCSNSGPVVDDDGELVDIIKFDAAGANKSLEQLGKHLALFTENINLGGQKDNPILIRRVIVDPAKPGVKDSFI